jgi:hyperosmotically inducible protein
MRALRKYPLAVACVVTLLSIGCKRGGGDSSLSGSGGTPGTAVADDLKGVAKQTEKTAKDIGHATADLADKAGQHLERLTDHAGADSQDAWITTKVKSALTGQGVDPLHVHVDTTGKVVTLSGTVPSAAERDKAVGAARTVTEVVEVKDHLFVQPKGR